MLTFFFFVNFPPCMLVGLGGVTAPFDRQGVGLGRLDGPLLPPGLHTLSHDIDSGMPEFKFGVPNLDRSQSGPPQDSRSEKPNRCLLTSARLACFRTVTTGRLV
jgi:hypothetical protein